MAWTDLGGAWWGGGIGLAAHTVYVVGVLGGVQERLVQRELARGAEEG